MRVRRKVWDAARLGMVRDLGKILIKTGALQLGTFTLTSGRLSSYYVDLRIIPSFPGAFRKTVESYVQLIQNEVGKVEAIAGVPTAGLPYASAVAYTLGKPFLYPRMEEREHGRKMLIEGVLPPGKHVMMLDDLITTGNSITKAADIVRNEGGVVEDAVVLIDRLEGGAEELRKRGVKLHSLTTILEIANLLSETQVISEEHLKAIRAQVRG